MSEEKIPNPESSREEVPESLLETRAVDILESLVDGEYENLNTYIKKSSCERIVAAWERISGIHGEFERITGTKIEHDPSRDKSDKAVDVHFTLNGKDFKTHTEFNDRGEITGFWILRGKNTTILDLIADTGQAVQHDAFSKISSVVSMLRSNVPSTQSKPQPVDKDERRVVEAVVDELDCGEYERLHDRFVPDIQDRIDVSELESAWKETVTDFQRIDMIVKQKGIIEVALEDTDGTKILTISLTDENTIDGFRVDSPD